VDIEQDRFKNLWVATENGLFILPQSHDIPVPVVQDVEFNRYAMSHYEDKIYAGSISGLYVFDTFKIEKGFLPVFYQMVSDKNSIFWKNLLLIALLIGLPGILLGFWLYKQIQKRNQIEINAKPESNKLGLEQIKVDIIAHKLISVEALALHYQTNTVQLNRKFKQLGTTPGKFLKKVKISWAKTLLKNGLDIEEVSKTVGYSPKFLDTELNQES
jgi:AraC-like DNA-binding protein